MPGEPHVIIDFARAAVTGMTTAHGATLIYTNSGSPQRSSPPNKDVSFRGTSPTAPTPAIGEIQERLSNEQHPVLAPSMSSAGPPGTPAGEPGFSTHMMELVQKHQVRRTHIGNSCKSFPKGLQHGTASPATACCSAAVQGAASCCAQQQSPAAASSHTCPLSCAGGHGDCGHRSICGVVWRPCQHHVVSAATAAMLHTISCLAAQCIALGSNMCARMSTVCLCRCAILQAQQAARACVAGHAGLVSS